MKESKQKYLHQTFGKADRFPKQKYCCETSTFCELIRIKKDSELRGPTFPKGQRKMFNQNSETPGPGNYNISVVRVFRIPPEQPYKVNKEFLDYMNSRPKSIQHVYPGPGAYEFKSTLSKRKISFTRARMGSFSVSQSPGPGQYTISRPVSRVY
ncbi:unnamed protein product (macronuclear) [Paramecium tetraurelia]|uniref:Uncharacterized protein n=1 Tax=Paramecium tetraurelia TaxID=5888 RepID=A0C8R9_PARTE|nr:uncharacterized protein GSPATT00036321001 [Paramecium tetraurelia]CAK67186.1 unnamed protein product [Paramecium tetraurelia]|eukprot:XP_001434583.1 hypothetical protein (macronuclear) [Paramecium tetraurelia strain d4-2]